MAAGFKSANVSLALTYHYPPVARDSDLCDILYPVRRKILRTIDIPQADSLTLVRQVLEAIDKQAPTVTYLSSRTGFSARHVRYRLEAARILGLVDQEFNFTPRGHRLLETSPGTREEQIEMRRAVRNSVVVKVLALNLSSADSLDTAKTARAIVAITGMSPATAERRSKALRSWFRQVLDNQQ